MSAPARDIDDAEYRRRLGQSRIRHAARKERDAEIAAAWVTIEDLIEAEQEVGDRPRV